MGQLVHCRLVAVGVGLRLFFRVETPGTGSYDPLGQILETSQLPGETTGPKEISSGWLSLRFGTHGVESPVPHQKSVLLPLASWRALDWILRLRSSLPHFGLWRSAQPLSHSESSHFAGLQERGASAL